MFGKISEVTKSERNEETEQLQISEVTKSERNEETE